LTPKSKYTTKQWKKILKKKGINYKPKKHKSKKKLKMKGGMEARVPTKDEATKDALDTAGEATRKDNINEIKEAISLYMAAAAKILKLVEDYPELSESMVVVGQDYVTRARELQAGVPLELDESLEVQSALTALPDFQHPRWVPDEESDSCMLCKKSFAMFDRKHHCRSCGILVCHDCSNQTKNIYEYFDDKNTGMRQTWPKYIPVSESMQRLYKVENPLGPPQSLRVCTKIMSERTPCFLEPLIETHPLSRDEVLKKTAQGTLGDRNIGVFRSYVESLNVQDIESITEEEKELIRQTIDEKILELRYGETGEGEELKLRMAKMNPTGVTATSFKDELLGRLTTAISMGLGEKDVKFIEAKLDELMGSKLTK